MIDKNKIDEWLKAAYEYYWGVEDPGMSDYQWDYLAREIYKDFENQKQHLPQKVVDKMLENGWEGGSLFFVPKDAYK